MSRQKMAFWGACLASWGMAISPIDVAGQDAKSESRGALPPAAAGDTITVKRDAVRVLQPQAYRVSMWLEPIRSVTLTAPCDGIVRQADGKPNSKVQPQTDVIRLDSTVAKLKVQQAEAALRVATAEQKQDADKDDLHKSLAQAKVDVAKADVDLAKYLLEQLSVRAPFGGELQRILVTEGQFVRAGEPLAVIVDVTKVRVEIPMERSAAVQGKSLQIKVESSEVEGKIESVLPLSERFKALRDLFDSITSATVVLENAEGRLKVGQTVHVPLVPRQPIAEVPASAVGNLPDGQRKVQVVRHLVVRDIPVLLMGSVGPGRLFVSGTFGEGDEVIVETSNSLIDGYQLKPAAMVATPPPGTTPAPATQVNPATKPTVGF